MVAEVMPGARLPARQQACYQRGETEYRWSDEAWMATPKRKHCAFDCTFRVP